MRIALTIVVAMAASLLPAQAATAVEPEGGVALTAEQFEDFAAAARAAGVDAELVELARTDPAVVAAVPIYEELEPISVVDSPAMPKQPGMDTLMGVSGRTVTRSVVYRNWWRARLASFTVSKYWEYDGRRVRFAPAARAWGSVTGTGALLGWDYEGVIRASDYYFTANGVWRGAHRSWRQGKFKHCAGPWGCFWKKYPQITIDGYGTGRYSWSRRG